MPSVLLVRHGQASFGGPDYDVLSARGHAQAAALAGDLKRRGVHVERVVSGSLARQRDTADPIAAAMGCAVTIDARWDEYDTDDILTHHSTTLVREERPPGSAAPAVSSREFQALLEGGLLGWIEAGADSPAAEPWPAFAARVAGALAEVAAGLPSGSTAVVCTSGGPLATTCVALFEVPAPAFVAFNRVVVNAGVTKVVHGRSGTTIVSFNEHAHLEADGASLVTYR